MYQPHLRHMIPLPPRYLVADPNPELFQIIVDVQQPPHTSACWGCPQDPSEPSRTGA